MDNNMWKNFTRRGTNKITMFYTIKMILVKGNLTMKTAMLYLVRTIQFVLYMLTFHSLGRLPLSSQSLVSKLECNGGKNSQRKKENTNKKYKTRKRNKTYKKRKKIKKS